ncbi:hypothetical protein INR49_016968 [Caranx melampygus]|nr:hypothetical protein INR49_016968 [Caranx melampygus]
MKLLRDAPHCHKMGRFGLLRYITSLPSTRTCCLHQRISTGSHPCYQSIVLGHGCQLRRGVSTAPSTNTYRT